MTNNARILTVLAVLVAVVPATAQTGLRRQLLDNGGFEQGLTAWQPDPGHQLVQDPEQAHSGNNCLTGEVTKDSDARILKREVELRAGKLYEFTVWARATNRTKLVLWIETGGERQMVSAWQNVPAKWTAYSAPMSAPAGRVVLEIVAPSSHGAPAGQMWIDDVALFEYDLPASSEVSGGVGFNDCPAMVCTRDGSAWFAWVSFRDGKDTLQVARAAVKGDEVTPTGTWQVATGSDAYLLDPTLATDGEAVWLAYAAERSGNWDVYAARLRAAGPEAPVQVSRDPTVDVKPACAVQGGKVWVAWESNRDDAWRRIYLSRIEGGRPTEAQGISPRGCSSYAPSLAVVGGAPYVVWTSFRENNFDLYAYDGSAQRPGESRVTTAPTVDREPRVVTAGDGVWLAWDNANSTTYHVGAARAKRVQVARVTPAGLRSPLGLAGTVLGQTAELADLGLDAQGRLWVVARVPRGKNAGWDVLGWCYSGDEWSEKLRVASRKGLARRPQVGFAAGRVLVCYQGDDIPNAWPTVEAAATATSGVYVAALEPVSAPEPRSLALGPYEAPEEEFEAAALRVARGEDRPRHSISYQGQTLNLYFGDLHEHTDISVCNRTGDQTQDQSYQSIRDIGREDFAALTDHGYNFNDYLWDYTAKMARSNNDEGRFLTFLGEEWTSSFENYTDEHPYGYYGHRNLILEDPYYPRWFNSRDAKTPAEVWEVLRQEKVSFIHIPHQLADTGNVPTDWKYVDEEAQPVAEIFQTRGSYEYEGTPRQAKNATPKGWFLQDAWARGIVIGVIAAPDHGGGYGKAAVYAPELSRKAILEAIRARHTYGTTAAKILLEVRVNGRLMGEKIPAAGGKPVRVEVRASCPGEIARVEVCRNNQFIYAPEVTGKDCDITFVDNDPPAGPCYYYVRVIQKDEEIAWSSPVWLGEAGPI